MAAKKKEEVTQSSSPPPIIQQKLDIVKFTEMMVTIVNTVNSLKEQTKTSEYRMKAMELEIANVQRRNKEYEEILESIKKD